MWSYIDRPHDRLSVIAASFVWDSLGLYHLDSPGEERINEGVGAIKLWNGEFNGSFELLLLLPLSHLLLFLKVLLSLSSHQCHTIRTRISLSIHSHLID